LSKREQIPLASLRGMYENIREYYAWRDALDGQHTELIFIWHGGEPLLLPPEYYWSTFSDQETVFGGCFERRNVVQTNLTVLNGDRLNLLKNGFDSVGVSFDVFGGLRQTLGNSDSQDRVLKHLDRLRMEEVPFGVITVLTRKNLASIERIFEFFRACRIPFRLLPLFQGAYEGQHDEFQITQQDVIFAYCLLIDLWLESESWVEVIPTINHIQKAVRRLASGSPTTYFNKRVWNPVFVINTNGDCYSFGDPYGDRSWSSGNVFSDRFHTILNSGAYERSLAAAEARMNHNCTRCEFFGACDGYPIAEDHHRPSIYSGQPVECVVERAVLAYAAQRIEDVGFRDESGKLSFATDVSCDDHSNWPSFISL
jgi:uncharacterized protein